MIVTYGDVLSKLNWLLDIVKGIFVASAGPGCVGKKCPLAQPASGLVSLKTVTIHCPGGHKFLDANVLCIHSR